MKRFVIRYRDPGGPTFEWRCRAYDAEHARQKFIEGDAAEFGDWTDWEILSVEREKEPRNRRARQRIASREEQHARYIDCGPAAWDDRE